MTIRVPGYESASLSPPNLYDIREEARQLAATEERVAKKIGRERNWLEVTGICLHQTATELGERPGRWASLGAHIGITRTGKTIWVHPFDRIVYHGNGFNNRTVGIEIDGHYAGIEGALHTYWRPKSNPNRKPQAVTPETITATCNAIRWICDFVRRHGGEVTKLVAHRQASKTRRSDPGSAIWKSIALPMQSELSLDDGGKGFVIGGYPIPEAWNPEYSGIKY